MQQNIYVYTGMYYILVEYKFYYCRLGFYVRQKSCTLNNKIMNAET